MPRLIGVAVAVLLPAAVLGILALTGQSGSAEARSRSSITVSPQVVGVGVTFGGAEVLVRGTAPPETQVVIKVSTQPTAVKLSKKGKVMGLFWMTTERVVVENMPAFYALYASEPLETLLGKEEQLRIGADGECATILREARVARDEPGLPLLPQEEAQDYAQSLRDMYIKSGKYVPCVSCHRVRSRAPQSVHSSADGWDTVHLDRGDWELRLRLPADTPLGEYEVIAYAVREGKAVGTETGGFTVQKTGLVDTLTTMSTRSAPAYGAMSLAVVVLLGLSIGFIFPKGGH